MQQQILASFTQPQNGRSFTPGGGTKTGHADSLVENADMESLDAEEVVVDIITEKSSKQHAVMCTPGKLHVHTSTLHVNTHAHLYT